VIVVVVSVEKDEEAEKVNCMIASPKNCWNIDHGYLAKLGCHN